MPVSPASAIFAMELTGDIAGITYVQRGAQRRTSYVKSWPDKPATPAQTVVREKWKAGMAAWKALTPQQKETLEMVTSFYSMCAIGQNVWMSSWMRNDMEWPAELAASIGRPWP